MAPLVSAIDRSADAGLDAPSRPASGSVGRTARTRIARRVAAGLPAPVPRAESPRGALDPAAAILGRRMADQAITYDLVLLLSNDAPEEQRTRILSAVESAIGSGGGSVERNDDWGRRPMAYEIRHRSEAEYHLLQFQAPPSVIEELSHTLRITDGVVRFRIIKVRRGTPPVKAGAPPVVAAVASPGLSASEGGRAGRGPAPSAEEPEQDAAEEVPAPEPSPAADADDDGSSAE
jgi:small subunit ribosomal protein S6